MNKKLENLRKQIDDVDDNILTLLAKRMEVVRKIGKLKKENEFAVFDKDRWYKILKSKLVRSDSLGLSKILIKKFYNLIHKYSLEIQKKV